MLVVTPPPGSRVAELGIAGAGTASVLAAAPWWIVGLVVLSGGAVAVVRAVFPQNSKDRLEWWKDRREHRERRGQSGPPAGGTLST